MNQLVITRHGIRSSGSQSQPPHVAPHRKAGRAIMVSTDLARAAACLDACPVEDLLRWRHRHERLRRLQAEKIIELSREAGRREEAAGPAAASGGEP